VELVPTPAPVNHAPQPKLIQKPVLVAALDPPPNALRLPAPVSQPKPKIEDAPVPEVRIEKKLAPLPTSAPIIPQTVHTNVFGSTGSSATPTTTKTAEQVQTGGFGDPHGVPAKDNNGKAAVNIAQLGSFDMPSGPGQGNGIGGANGAKGVVVNTGFGNGVATSDPRAAVPRGTVQQGGFGNADVAAPPTVRARIAEPASKLVQAEILSKPTPIYTEEARRLRIEGEVLLEVVLGSNGKLHVVRVVRGLGHGLDDEAVREAEQIRFKPAQRDGQPTDSTVVLHIIFQLA
jgi:TonB family protein